MAISSHQQVLHKRRLVDTKTDSIRGSYADSQAVLDDLAALGVDYDDVVQTLEDQGVTAFDASWDHLGRRLATALGTREE
jgi:transaldolase